MAAMRRSFILSKSSLSCAITGRLDGHIHFSFNSNVFTALSFRSRRFSSFFKLNAKVKLLNLSIAGSSPNTYSILRSNYIQKAKRYCTNQGFYEGLKEKVQHILSKSPAGTQEKLDQQLNLLKLLNDHYLGNMSMPEFTEAAQKVHADVIYELALVVYTLRERVGEKSDDFWAPLFRLSSLKGNQDAKYTYAQMLRSGTGIDPDPSEAIRLFQELADHNHAYAQFALAGMYFHGIALEQDYHMAFDLYEQSSKNGADLAFNMLGNMYLNGYAVEKNYKLAIQYFQTGVQKGEPNAELSLAHCYSHGKGVSEDLSKAFEYHISAAEKGHPIALYNVGTQYFAGKGVEMNMVKAAEYFEKSASFGFDLAQINLGNMYYNGIGVQKDWNKAKEWYRQAAPTNKNAAALLKEVEEDERRLKDDKSND